MNDNTDWTPFADDNYLGLTDKDLINEHEVKGIVNAELFVFGLDVETAFSELYEWAGKWRSVDVRVGQIEPPKPIQLVNLMYQFIDNLNYKISIAATLDEKIETIVYAHYEFIKIHPFNNGNGRTGRIIMNLAAMKMGFRPLELYKREGESRRIYIKAMQLADYGNFDGLTDLVKNELVVFKPCSFITEDTISMIFDLGTSWFSRDIVENTVSVRIFVRKSFSFN